jgi:hypothetical protein
VGLACGAWLAAVWAACAAGSLVARPAHSSPERAVEASQGASAGPLAVGHGAEFPGN